MGSVATSDSKLFPSVSEELNKGMIGLDVPCSMILLKITYRNILIEVIKMK